MPIRRRRRWRATGFLVEDFTPERLDMTLTLPEGPVDPARGRGAGGAGGFPVRRAGGGSAARGRGDGVAGARGSGPRRAMSSGWRTSRSGRPTPQLPAGLTHGRRGRGADRAADAADRAGEPAAAADRDAAGRATASGRPVERSVTRPMLSAAPLIGVRPLFDGAVDQGANAGVRGDRARAGPRRASALGPVDWTLSRVDTTFQWYEVDGNWNYEPITRRDAGRERVARSRRPTRRARSTCRWTGAATSCGWRRPTGG